MAETKPKTKTLHAKLLEVQKAVTHLQKNTRSGDGQYAYVGSSQVLGAIREKMDEEGLLLQVQLVEHALHIDGAYSYLEKPQHFTEVVLEFTWVNVDDPEQRESFRWYGQGIDSGEKGPGKAYTYGEKYFLLKFFHVPTDKDDPDAQAAPNSSAQAAPRQQQPSASGEFGPCPDCGAVLQVRKRKDGGEFVGCLGYPACKFTCDVEKAPALPTEYDGKVDAEPLEEEAVEVFADTGELPTINTWGGLKNWMDEIGVDVDDLTPLREAACQVNFGAIPKASDLSKADWAQVVETIAEAVRGDDVRGFIADAVETQAAG